ncbi:hypothetical protein BKA93DRAFT_743853 [Sparassis latifolia]|uniref:Nascent polypeptide-associated complex subunit alpha-like UBA domain-containing protein n=1 Tax=Sparassis crispa TaxID=139825 RepID=A0A401GI62_9APHY|nr:hypothetical protein SCP_0402330 [Sparassis crispa]GBE81859.1 hypothetical protein SCP_0402330 [Sparassis crispa]
MSHLARSNGRPEPEVIVNFADGCAYSKGKMEEVFRSGFMDKPVAKHAREPGSAKRDDIDLLVHELEIPRHQAERLLIEKNGDIVRVLEDWVSIPGSS